jgi:Holliday junction resolvase RusA-like endonuclease
VKPDAPKWYPSTPDWDNVGKWIGDALNGTFWHDDRLIVVGKVYAVYGAVPGVAVEIQPPTEIEYQHALSLVGSVRRNT